ncbi:MAG: NPCBM/NEW2 domain-containing protein [Verrucomicrobia subdivision 3 bacterium]|nr:NPCBM/NEW2 domain-containing protein [Limisphaerales bacterium]
MVASTLAQTPATNSQTQFLSDQPELILASGQGWGELGWNVAAHAGDKAGDPLRIGDRSFEKGLGHHANGSITVLLDGAFSAFDAEVGLQPCAAVGSVIFRVFVDGVQRFESPVRRSGDAPVAVHVAVAGAMELRLETADAGDGLTCDMANWVNARLTRSANPGVESADQRVDIGRFGRVVTWEPNRNDGSRADRIQEFRAEDLFLERDLTPDADGRFTLPVATNQLACVGLQWLNRRALREARLGFASATQVPPTNTVRVEGWFGESAWQGEFKPLAGQLEQAGNELVFHMAARADKGVLLQTRKLRWILPARNGSPLVIRPQAYTRSRWAVTNLVVQIASADKQATAEVEITNGELLPLTAAPLRLSINAPQRLQVRYARLSPLKSDPTVLQFRLPSGAFGIAVEDVLRQGSVFVPDHALLVTTESEQLTIAEAQRKVAASKTILQEVRQLPDQTYALAMAKTHHLAQSEGPVMLSLACDNAKFVVERDGRVRFHTNIVTDTDWFKNAGELRPEFGEGPTQLIRRHLDGGWLPSPVMKFLNEGVTYFEHAFVAPADEPGTNAARLNRRSVCVIEFTLNNEQAKESPARLALNFAVNSREKTAASIVHCPQGWLVSGEQGPLALVTSTANSDLTATIEEGKLVLAGMLPSQGTARCVVYLRAQDEDLLNLPSFAQLRVAFESHWNAVLAPAMQIATPDPLLNDIIRSSQVRCLIDARNEADGQRVAAWIAAMSYGPLESEAHSVIRGMAFFGHEDFSRRSLDFFIHRYNTNGFLTTGYTTFGTAWHLWTAGEHQQLYHDQAWLRAAAPEFARVGEWIVRQADKTMSPAAEGRPESGLMPPGVIADWNAFAYHFANNAYYYAALRELGGMLAEIQDPRAGSFTTRARQLRANTLRAYHWTQARSPAVALRTGAWTPHYPSQVHSPGALADFFPGQDAGRSWCYDVEIGAHQLVPTGVMEADSREVERMLEHMEDVQFLSDGWFDYPATTNHADWFNLGGFSKVQPYYTRNAEIYAMRDEVKPFLRSYFNSLAAMLNPEVLTLWEHFNHSGAWDKTHETGYFLHQTREMLVQERGDELWLAPLITSNWLKDGLSVAVTNAPTRFGRVSYHLTSRAQSGAIEARIEPPTRSTPKAIVLRLRHPEGKRLRTVMVNGQPHNDFDRQKETIRVVPNAVRPITVRAEN